MSGPIFGTSTQLGSSGGNRHLVEFRAGRMNMAGKMVHPDARKGLVYLYQSDDQLIHFCWKDRTSGTVEDDLIIFPDDCEFKKVEQCKTGRVYLLRFKSSNRKLFFWMQEPKTDKDDEWCRRINEVMNNPPSSNSLGSGGRGTDSGDLQYMLNNLSQQQLMQLFGGVGQMGGLSSLLGSMNRSSGGSSTRNNASSPSNRTSSSATPGSGSGSSVAATPTTVSASNAPSTPRAPKKGNNTNQAATTPSVTGAGSDNSRVLLSELQNYLAGINTGAAGGSSSGSRRNIDLSSSINSEALDTVVSNPDYVNSLVAHLPEVEGDEDKKQQLKDTLSSPQFQQALSTFSNALQSGQLGPVVSQFQLNTEAVAAAVSGDLEQFVKALEKTLGKNEKEPETKTATSDPKPDDDDEMSMG